MSVFHIYNRGAHKAPIFEDWLDYWHMLKLLYIANSPKPFVIEISKNDIFRSTGSNSGRYYRLLLDAKSYSYSIISYKRGCLSKFMRKLSDGYVKYYNLKNKHFGTIWQGKYKSKPVFDNDYLSILINYIHLNPYKIIDPDISDQARLEPGNIKKAIEYPKTTSFRASRIMHGEKRPQGMIL